MKFEFDGFKSASNQVKHGIDFLAAQALWDDPDFIETPAHLSDEPRWRVTGRINGRLYTAIITYRGSIIRIISMRRAHPDEERLYEQAS
ncbi:MAG: BrnT family toxin [Propionibacteriaceae bacterium]|jgi:uncharacterized DUF497 family protein|nr:BrnT family toxin [Propionibacteriaceae bacterium]